MVVAEILFTRDRTVIGTVKRGLRFEIVFLFFPLRSASLRARELQIGGGWGRIFKKRCFFVDDLGLFVRAVLRLLK